MGWMEVVGLAITGIATDSQSEISTAVSVAGSMRSTVSTIASTIDLRFAGFDAECGGADDGSGYGHTASA